MKQLRYLQTISLYKNDYTVQSNGNRTATKTLIGNYNVATQELSDDVSASIYGANLNKMLRLSSPRYELEGYLEAKMSPVSDNITKYIVLLGGKYYAVKAVKKHWVEIEFQETASV